MTVCAHMCVHILVSAHIHKVQVMKASNSQGKLYHIVKGNGLLPLIKK